MTEPSIIPPGGGEVIGDSPDRRVEILSDADAVHATWSRFAAGRDGADLHVHRRHFDVFYVLAGELTLRLGIEDEPVLARAGTFVCVPPLVVHGFRNAGDAEVRYLNLHAPGTGFADYMRGLRDGRRTDFDQEPPPAEGIRPRSEASIGAGGVRVPPLAASEVRHDPGDPPVQVDGDAEYAYVLAGVLELTPGARAEAGAWVRLAPGGSYASGAGAPVRLLRVSGSPGA